MADGLPIFFGDAEEKFFNNAGRELIERFINQHLVLYSISSKETESNFYGEAKNKMYDKYTDLKARIRIEDQDVFAQGGVRRVAKSDMTCWIYNEHLKEEGVKPRIGDFIGYAGKFYEIYDAGIEKDSLERKFAGDREYFTEIRAKVTSPDIFKSIEGNLENENN